MDSFIAFGKWVLPVLTLIGGGLVVVILVSLVLERFIKPAPKIVHRITNIMRTHAALYSFIVAFIATLGSLFYSDVAGFSPCKLCWLQRIFMYPLSIYFAVALIVRTFDWRFPVALVIPGGLLALFHSYLQHQASNPFAPCATVGYSVSCSEHFGVSYGYITIPVMAATAFVLIGLLMYNRAKKNTA